MKKFLEFGSFQNTVEYVYFYEISLKYLIFQWNISHGFNTLISILSWEHLAHKCLEQTIVMWLYEILFHKTRWYKQDK